LYRQSRPPTFFKVFILPSLIIAVIISYPLLLMGIVWVLEKIVAIGDYLNEIGRIAGEDTASLTLIGSLSIFVIVGTSIERILSIIRKTKRMESKGK
jgi:hypothetical protein